jgi:transcriptional regulator with XRE-family HTH domain
MTGTKIPKSYYRLGRSMQKIRKSKGLTQEQLAEKINVSTTWIGYLETGYRIPNIKMLNKIARALGVKVNDIVPF